MTKNKGNGNQKPDQNFEIINLKSANFKALAKKINALQPDLVFVSINASRAGQLWKDLRHASKKIILLMAGDNLTVPPFLDEAGTAAEGTYIITGGISIKG